MDPQSPTITAAQEEAERAGFSRDHSNFRTPVGRFQQSPSVPLLPSCCTAVNATGHLCCLPADVMCSVPAAAQRRHKFHAGITCLQAAALFSQGRASEFLLPCILKSSVLIA
jgi:hypothetical protein